MIIERVNGGLITIREQMAVKLMVNSLKDAHIGQPTKVIVRDGFRKTLGDAIKNNNYQLLAHECEITW